jgi:hypothetical protein
MHVTNTPGLSVLNDESLPSGGLDNVAAWCGVDDVTQALASVSTAPRLVVSGRLSSGKDSVADAVMAELRQGGSTRLSFATALRDEVAELLAAISPCADLDTAVAAVANVSGLTADKVVNTTDLLWTALRLDPKVTPYTRTREMRLALQDWGTGVRRAEDPHYWVKRGARTAMEAMACGSPVHITDARFINEVQIARALGFFAVRLEVDLDIRAQRLWDRDGLTIDPASENHPSEVELETYPGFDLWVSNNGPLPDTVRNVIAAMP